MTLGIEALKAMLAELDANGTASMLPGNGERGYCAVCGNSIIATAIINEREDIGYLWGMYVASEHQRAGIGSALLSACLSSLTCARTLEVRVLETSSWAISFYQRHDFAITGWDYTELLDGVKTGTLVMSRSTQLPLALPTGVCL